MASNTIQLTGEELAEFKQIYFECTGIELSDIDAMEQALKLLYFMRAVSGHDLSGQVEG